MWKEQMDYFFLSWRMRSAPGHPPSMDPPQMRMRTWVAGGYLRRGHRGCGSAPNSGLREIGGPWRTALVLNHSPTTLGTMAAVAAASAELLIIGWYIFRVLLQVSVPRFRVAEGSRCAPP